MIETLKAPPHNLDAERHVIGGLLLQPDAFDRIDWLTAEQFYSSQHKLIYAAQRTLIEAGKPLDTFLLCNALGDDLERAGGKLAIELLALNTPSAANITRYAELVRDKAIVRGILSYAMDLSEAAHTHGAKPQELAELADSRLFDIMQSREQSEALPFHKTIDSALQGRQTSDSGLTTNYIDLDRLIKRMRGGNLIIVAGRPSMGKSGLAACIAEHCAWDSPVAFYSLEMSRAELGERILAWHERGDTERAVTKLSALQLYIDTPPALTIGLLRLKLRRQKRKHGLALAVVDYLQLMKGDGENRTQEIGSISRGLKLLAMEFDIPIIAICQLNRGVETRADKRPLLSDLRESGDIEQDADIVLMVYRDEYYNANSIAAGTAEIIVRKHRSGRLGMARLTFIGDSARFENYAGPEIYEPQAQPARNSGKLHAVDLKSRATGDE